MMSCLHFFIGAASQSTSESPKKDPVDWLTELAGFSVPPEAPPASRKKRYLSREEETKDDDKPRRHYYYYG